MWLIPQNDAPVIEAPIQLRGQEDEAFSIASLRVEDVDVGESFGATLRVQLRVCNGQIQLSKFLGLKLASKDYLTMAFPEMEVPGSVETLNEALSTLIYTDDTNWHGTDTLLVVVSYFG
jgi:hypothetical protein